MAHLTVPTFVSATSQQAVEQVRDHTLHQGKESHTAPFVTGGKGVCA